MRHGTLPVLLRTLRWPSNARNFTRISPRRTSVLQDGNALRPFAKVTQRGEAVIISPVPSESRREGKGLAVALSLLALCGLVTM